jgi:hypothetical protein
MLVWYAMYGHLICFTAIWYILWPFAIFVGHLVYFSVLVCCNKKNLATLEGNKFADVVKSNRSLEIFSYKAAAL